MKTGTTIKYRLWNVLNSARQKCVKVEFVRNRHSSTLRTLARNSSYRCTLARNSSYRCGIGISGSADHLARTVVV